MIAEAAAGVEAVGHLLLVSSYLPEVGESLSSFGDGSPAPFLDVDPTQGTFTVRPELLVDLFLPDCPPEIGREALRHLALQNASVLQQPVTAAAWQHTPSTYLVCADDRGTPASAQRASPSGRAASPRSLPGTTRSCRSPTWSPTWWRACSDQLDMTCEPTGSPQWSGRAGLQVAEPPGQQAVYGVGPQHVPARCLPRRRVEQERVGLVAAEAAVRADQPPRKRPPRGSRASMELISTRSPTWSWPWCSSRSAAAIGP